VAYGAARGLSGRGDRDGHDLFVEPARVAGGAGVLLGAQRERVDLFATELVAIGDVLRGFDHADVGVAAQQDGVGWAAGAGPHGVEQ
jgi:hypothetical protein